MVRGPSSTWTVPNDGHDADVAATNMLELGRAKSLEDDFGQG